MLQAQTGAESIRQLPTLTLFKINMNLEMEQGTEALAAAVDAAPPRELERQPYDEQRHRGDPRAPGADGGHRAPLRRRRAPRSGCRPGAFLDHLEGMVDRKLLRRVAAILYHRRAGFSANGMGVWRVPEERDRWRPERGWPPFAGSRTATSARPTPDWPYSVFTMAHGRSKEECDAVLDGIADEHELHGEDRAVLYSSTEFKKVRLRYFTDDYARWEREHAGPAR